MLLVFPHLTLPQYHEYEPWFQHHPHICPKQEQDMFGPHTCILIACCLIPQKALKVPHLQADSARRLTIACLGQHLHESHREFTETNGPCKNCLENEQPICDVLTINLIVYDDIHLFSVMLSLPSAKLAVT